MGPGPRHWVLCPDGLVRGWAQVQATAKISGCGDVSAVGGGWREPSRGREAHE